LSAQHWLNQQARIGWDDLEEPMHQAASMQFERLVREFAQWRAVPEPDRSPAPAWWWGPALEMRDVRQPMPADWCARLELPVNSSLADGAQVFLDCLADQTSLPWPGGFPGNAKH
jgi:hypothetical protein